MRFASLAVVLALPLWVGSSRAATPPGIVPPLEKPNVVVIVTDDQRGGIEVMPRTKQAFVSEGRSYPNAFVTTPLCCPARASIMTGRYVHNHKVMSNGEDDWRDLDHGDTLQRQLNDAGYHTALFGKFLNHWPVEMDPPHFDEWALLPDVTGRLGYYGSNWNVNGTIKKISRYSTDYLAETASSFIEERESADTEPWYMYIATGAAHRSFVAEPDHAKASVPRWRGNPAVFEKDRSDKPRYVRRADTSFEEGREIRKRQFRTLMSVDELVGDVLSTADALGEDTLAIYISDSGLMWGEHGLSNKQVPYEESVQVPFWLRWPGTVAPGTDERIVANIDIAPTVLSAAGLTNETDGNDLLDPSWTRDRILLEYFGDKNAPSIPRWASTWTPDGQYVEYYSATGDLAVDREYYDLVSDPWQLRNLRNPPDASWLTRLDADRACAGATCP